jgi:hypothetical protein
MLSKLSYRLALALPFIILMFTFCCFVLANIPANTSELAVKEPLKETKTGGHVGLSKKRS